MASHASRSFAVGGASEGIDRVSLRGPPNGLDEHRVIGDVDGNSEELGDVLGYPDIPVQVDVSRWIDLDQNVEIAVRGRLPTGRRTEQRRALHTLAAQGRFVGAQDRDDSISGHTASVTANPAGGEEAPGLPF